MLNLQENYVELFWNLDRQNLISNVTYLATMGQMNVYLLLVLGRRGWRCVYFGTTNS